MIATTTAITVRSPIGQTMKGKKRTRGKATKAMSI
jgi:hypothetical protein